MMNLMRFASPWLDPTATATVALAAVAGVQIIREIRRDLQRRAAIKRRLTGAAWLARRSCEVTVRSAPGDHMDHRIAMNFTCAPALDRLQRHFREVLALSGAIGGSAAGHGERAFSAFLAAADRLNELVQPTTPATASVMMFPTLCQEGLGFLYDAVLELEHLAPRRPHEPGLPPRSAMQRPARVPPLKAPASPQASPPSGGSSQ
jgi:hypothetical protein